MTNNAETIRGRCKSETNIEIMREGGMAKIDGVDEGDEAEGAGGREESDEWDESGNRKFVRKHDPRQPSQQEKEEHEMTHLPFRSWCRHCIMGRGREEDCRKTMEEESGKFRKCIWITCSWETRRKGRRWHSWLREKGRRGLCSARWFLGRRRVNGFAED